MIPDTIQNALKRLFCSIGGNADNVRNKDDINAILDEMTALNIGKEISGAGTNVVANPTLAGTEDPLTGLEVDGTKYKVGGSGGGVLVVHDVDGILDKTYSEILSGGFGVIETVSEEEAWYYPILAVYAAPDGTEYNVFCAAVSSENTISGIKYSASSADGYPEYT